ncbi:MAG TPA: hypothetical protein VJ623_01300 [Holophagaceae bacterium]|nr:hypothetical protein [Holophagaceae bacterium]
MRRSAAALAASALGLCAQVPQVGGLLQVWALQPLGPTLPIQGPGYYDPGNATFQEGLLLRRAQVQVAGPVPGDLPLHYLVMADFALPTTGPNPANGNAPYNPSLLQDAWIEGLLGAGFHARLGQFKNLQTWEGLVAPADLPFAERSQIGRRFADRRDRGLALRWEGEAGGFGLQATVGIFNGTNDLAAGKASDANGRRDGALRVEATRPRHRLGFYGLRGGTDQRESGLQAKAFPGPGAPDAASVRAAGDLTENLGAYYVYAGDAWHGEVEAITGRWGRRYPSLGPQPGPAGREILDQRFLGITATLAFTRGPRSWALRWDRLDGNPARAGATATEVTAGFTRRFGAADLRVNALHRFGALGIGLDAPVRASNALLLAFQVAF